MKKTMIFSEKRLNNIIAETVKRTLNEYIDSANTSTMGAILDEMTEAIGGPQEMLDAIVAALGGDKLLEQLRYIDRCYDLHVIEKYEQ